MQQQHQRQQEQFRQQVEQQASYQRQQQAQQEASRRQQELNNRFSQSTSSAGVAPAAQDREVPQAAIADRWNAAEQKVLNKFKASALAQQGPADRFAEKFAQRQEARKAASTPSRFDRALAARQQ
jgi:hypothetical protein